MKKILLTLAAMMLISTASHAQFGNLLNQVAGAVTSIAGGNNGNSANDNSTASALGGLVNTIAGIVSSNTLTSVDVVGDWNYMSSAVALSSSSNAISTMAASAAQSILEKKLDEYLAKIGIKSGLFKINFMQDGNMTLTYGTKTFNGTWAYDQSSDKVTLKLFKLVTVKAIVAKESTGELRLLFDASSLMKLIKSIASQSNNATVQSIGTLLQSYDQFYAGFKMSK